MSRLRARALLSVALLAVSGACTPKHASQSQAQPRASAQTIAPSAAPASNAAPAEGTCAQAPSNRLNDALLTAFAERFRKTQIDGDFASYSALYAEHFSGLFRDGPSFSRLNRDRWLLAHQHSFAASPGLASARIHVAVGAGGGQIRFVSSAKHADALPELFVIRTNSGLQIAREAPVRPRPSDLTQAPGVWLADERFAILSAKPDPSWFDGPAVFDGNGTALSNVAVERLPKALRSWLGRPVRVLGAAGAVCETRLQRFAIRSQITPDLATAEHWDGCADEPVSPAAIAEEIVRLTAFEGRTLVAEFATPCKGALFASDPDLPAPPLAAPEPASAELGQMAFAALRELPAYASVQARFKTEQPDAEGAWEDHDARRRAWSIALPGDELVLASVAAGAGCGSFSASVSAVWHVTGGSLRLLGELAADNEKSVAPRALLGLGGGAPALVLGPDGDYRTLHVFSEAARTDLVLTSVPFFAGPC